MCACDGWGGRRLERAVESRAATGVIILRVSIMYGMNKDIW